MATVAGLGSAARGVPTETPHPLLQAGGIGWQGSLGREMGYRCEAATVAGFVQQLACCYVRHGYFYYVVGKVPERKDAREIDAKMIERYRLAVSKYARARRKRAGLANAQYLRYRSFFVLCATEPHGEHAFFEAHAPKQIRDVRRAPIAFAGYSIGYHRGADRRWHVSVRIHPNRYRELKAYLLEQATRCSRAQLERELGSMPFVPYAPIRRQYLAIWRALNRERKTAGLPRLSRDCLRMTRTVVRPFGEAEGKAEEWRHGRPREAA